MKWKFELPFEKKKKKKSKRDNRVMFLEICIITSILTLLISVYLFAIGYHNYDFGQNLVWIETKFNITLIDNTLEGNQVDGVEAYLMGNRQSRFAFGLAIISSIVFGLSFGEYSQMVKSQK